MSYKATKTINEWVLYLANLIQANETKAVGQLTDKIFKIKQSLKKQTGKWY